MKIASIASAVPDGIVTQETALDFALRMIELDAREQRRIAALYRLSGVKKRHSVVVDENGVIGFYEPGGSGPTTEARMEIYERHAAPLAARAAEKALADAGTDAAAITHLVTVSCTGFYAPGVDADLTDMLGLDASVLRTNIGFMGCHGAFNGLRTAAGFVDSDPNARVLLVAVELCGLHFHYGRDPEKVTANALFGDGAAAVVVTGDGAGEGPTIGSFHAMMFENSRDAMTWRVSDHGFVLTLSPKVPILIERHLRPWLDGWLPGQGLSVRDLRSFAVHPGGPRILDAVQAALGVDREALAASRETLTNLGNMSSPTVLMVLERMLAAGGDLPCLALGFGPGLTAEAAILGSGGRS
jgi:predicted naringenin-chalcone synthase